MASKPRSHHRCHRHRMGIWRATKSLRSRFRTHQQRKKRGKQRRHAAAQLPANYVRWECIAARPRGLAATPDFPPSSADCCIALAIAVSMWHIPEPFLQEELAKARVRAQCCPQNCLQLCSMPPQPLPLARGSQPCFLLIHKRKIAQRVSQRSPRAALA